MRTLFFKIFLSVLLTVLLTFIGGFAIAFWVLPRPDGFRDQNRASNRSTRHDPEAFAESWNTRMSDLVDTYARDIDSALAHDGLDAAEARIDQLDAWWNVHANLLDGSGKALREGTPSSALRDLASRTNAQHKIVTDTVENDKAEEQLIFAMRMQARDGTPYVFVAETPGAPRERHHPHKRPSFYWIIFMRTVPVAITLGLVCFVLARYITKPVLTMRSALRRFGEGDLEQRVGAVVGKRRDEIGELARDFDHMAERIETLLSAQRRLLEDISHELRSPLARQRVALELARQRSSADAIPSLDRVEREAERLDELVGQLLTLTRLESKTDKSVREPIDLPAMIREVVENAEFEAHNGSRSVQLTTCDECTVDGIPELLRRAIENVVRNALAYTAEGTAVEVSLQTTATAALIQVRDHGPGVPESELADIFRPFYRISNARERETGGVGLGLTIVDRAVRSHHGEVVARNQPGGGLLVEISIPLDVNREA
jgi:two-component system sensor histidine kinase CpxA